MPPGDAVHQVLELTGIVQELVETVRDQTKDLERLTTWLEQQTSLRDEPSTLSVGVSRLNALHRRAASLRSEMEDASIHR